MEEALDLSSDRILNVWMSIKDVPYIPIDRCSIYLFIGVSLNKTNQNSIPVTVRSPKITCHPFAIIIVVHTCSRLPKYKLTKILILPMNLN